MRSSQTQRPIPVVVNSFLSTVGEPFIADLVDEVETALEEASPVLPAFSVFHPRVTDQTIEHRRISQVEILLDHYGKEMVDVFNGDTVNSPALVSSLEALEEVPGFFEQLDDKACQAEREVQEKTREQCTSLRDIRQ